MHFKKMHAFFTYKMHALMHAFLRKVSIIWLQQMTLGLRWFWVNLANFANILPLKQIVGCQCVRGNLGHFDVASV